MRREFCKIVSLKCYGVSCGSFAMTTISTVKQRSVLPRTRMQGSSCEMAKTRTRLRWSLVPLLVVAIIVEAFGVMVNIKAILPLVVYPFGPPRGLYHSRPAYPRVLFEGTNEIYFDAAIGRPVEDMWLGSSEEGYDTNKLKTVEGGVLRNPVTLDNREGTEECVPAADWQTRHYPTCNAFHEVQFQFDKRGRQSHHDGAFLSLLGEGTSRDAWKLTKDDDSVVLKTLQMNRDFSGLNNHFQILDAIASERLTPSSYVNNIYGFCGFSAMNELGKELELDSSLTIAERLRYARDLAAGMADAHGIESDDKPLLVHADLRHSNVMFSQESGALTLSDFNQGYFLGWNSDANEKCGYLPKFSFWHDRFAAPEECLRQPQTDKADIYHLGGMVFYLMTGYKPYTFNLDDFQYREKNQKMPDGKWVLPVIPPRFATSKDPTILKFMKAIKACLQAEPSNRANAREVYSILEDALKGIEEQNRM